MKSLHLTTTMVLTVAVAILSAVLIRRGSHRSAPNTETETIAQTAPLRRIERMPEFEGAMNKLGYQAWGYRWFGGIVDGTIRIGPGDKNPITYDGKSKLAETRDFANALNEPAAALSSVTGSVLVVVGPIKDKRTSDVACRILVELSLPSGQKATTEYNLIVDYAAPQYDGDSGVSVASRWIENEEGNGFHTWTTDGESVYRLLELRWLPDSDPPKTQNQAVNPSDGSGEN